MGNEWLIQQKSARKNMKASNSNRLLANIFAGRGLNLLVKIKRKFISVIDFYREALNSRTNVSAVLRLIFFPLRGGEFGSSRVPYPARYWASYAWIDKICKYGANVIWSGNIVTVNYMGTKISANALDQSIETVFLRCFGTMNTDSTTWISRVCRFWI